MLSWAFISCGISTQEGTDDFEAFDSSKDYFEQKIDIKYARNFNVAYYGNYKVVRTNAKLSSWEGNGNEVREDVMVLVQKGTPAPALTGELSDATVIPIPAERVALNIQNGESFMSELGLFEKVVAVGGAVSYDDSIRNRVLAKDLAQIGYSWHLPANLEVLLETKSDLFLMNLANLDFADVLDKSRSFGVATAPVFEWAEGDYLGRAEWIKFYSLFFNAEAVANQKFAQIEEGVESVKTLTKKLDNKPTMVWGYYAGKDRWVVHTNSIEAQFMRDVGVVNLLEDFTRPVRNGGEPMSSEEFLVRANEAAHWMIGDIHSVALPSENFLERFTSWKNGNLYHNMRRRKPEFNAFDWYGEAVVRPDKILTDLVKLIHPERLPNYEPFFMDHFEKTMTLPLKVKDSFYN